MSAPPKGKVYWSKFYKEWPIEELNEELSRLMRDDLHMRNHEAFNKVKGIAQRLFFKGKPNRAIDRLPDPIDSNAPMVGRTGKILIGGKWEPMTITGRRINSGQLQYAVEVGEGATVGSYGYYGSIGDEEYTLDPAQEELFT